MGDTPDPLAPISVSIGLPAFAMRLPVPVLNPVSPALPDAHLRSDRFRCTGQKQFPGRNGSDEAAPPLSTALR
jgi:hypothetical protein